MAEPSEDDIIQIIEITGLNLNRDRDLAIQALKVYSSLVRSRPYARGY
jgi:hypothetical protein